MIRQAKRQEWDDAMALAWRTFLKYDAVDYTPEGIRSFREFVTSQVVYKMFITGSYEMFLALLEDTPIGLLSVRNVNHISLLFVDEAYHKKGVGRALFNYVAAYIRDEVGGDKITVDSSPMAFGFYKKMGFVETSEAITKNGIIYTPMCCLM